MEIDDDEVRKRRGKMYTLIVKMITENHLKCFYFLGFDFKTNNSLSSLLACLMSLQAYSTSTSTANNR